MVIEMPKRKIIYIGDEAPSGDPTYYGWIDTTTRTVKVYEGGHWVVKASFADTTEGFTGEIKNGKETFVFKNGLLVKYG
jgi:hypothetical protein